MEADQEEGQEVPDMEAGQEEVRVDQAEDRLRRRHQEDRLHRRRREDRCHRRRQEGRYRRRKAALWEQWSDQPLEVRLLMQLFLKDSERSAPQIIRHIVPAAVQPHRGRISVSTVAADWYK